MMIIPQRSGTGQKICDMAYGCFLVCGLVVLAISSGSLIKGQLGTALGMLLGTWLGLAALAAMPVGIILSLRAWRHPPLVFLSLLSVLFIVEILTEAGSVGFYNASGWVYGTVATLTAGWWFLSSERRQQG